MWTDYHTHILPDMDDGAPTADVSAQMLKKLREQGAEKVVLTSHFYSDQDSIDSFLERRERSFANLMAHPEAESFPPLYKGAEVRLELNMCMMDDLPRLCIEGTRYLLLEMPYSRYKEWMPREIENVAYRLKVTPILAHIDRYLAMEWIKKEEWEELCTFPDAIFQVNAKAFERRDIRHAIKRLAKDGVPLVYGTDAHNLGERAPDGNLLPADFLKKYPPQNLL